MTTLILARTAGRVDAVVERLRADGFPATGTTDDADALAWLDSGQITTVVVGAGVSAASRAILKGAAQTHGVALIDGAMRGREVDEYVRGELEPRLGRG